jgi:hypothetical protein
MIPNCEQSEQIDKIVPALIKAIGAMESARKESSNPAFKSKYADLTSVMDAAKPALGDNGIAVMQPVTADGEGVLVATVLIHTSGQWIGSRLALTPKDGSPQATGSAITYGRRYGLAGILGMTAEDDDGNAASQPGQARLVSRPKGAMKPMPRTEAEWEFEDPALVDYLNRAELSSDSAKDVYAELNNAIAKASDKETAREAYRIASLPTDGQAPLTKTKVRQLYKTWLGLQEPPV